MLDKFLFDSAWLYTAHTKCTLLTNTHFNGMCICPREPGQLHDTWACHSNHLWRFEVSISTTVWENSGKGCLSQSTPPTLTLCQFLVLNLNPWDNLCYNKSIFHWQTCHDHCRMLWWNENCFLWLNGRTTNVDDVRWAANKSTGLDVNGQ